MFLPTQVQLRTVMWGAAADCRGKSYSSSYRLNLQGTPFRLEPAEPRFRPLPQAAGDSQQRQQRAANGYEAALSTMHKQGWQPFLSYLLLPHGNASCSEGQTVCRGTCGGYCGYCGFGDVAGGAPLVTLLVADQAMFDEAVSSVEGEAQQVLLSIVSSTAETIK